jgi:hypothetical protein
LGSSRWFLPEKFNKLRRRKEFENLGDSLFKRGNELVGNGLKLKVFQGCDKIFDFGGERWGYKEGIF